MLAKNEDVETDRNKVQFIPLIAYPETEQQYISFCTPEATKAINEYLEWRKRRGESFNNESPLFRIQFNNRDLLKIRAPAQFLTLKAMDFILNKLLDKTGIKTITYTLRTAKR